MALKYVVGCFWSNLWNGLFKMKWNAAKNYKYVEVQASTKELISLLFNVWFCVHMGLNNNFSSSSNPQGKDRENSGEGGKTI